jgi:hypothetical protein
MARQKRTRKRKQKKFGKLNPMSVAEVERFAGLISAQRRKLSLGENAFVPLPRQEA